jgi:hypothetical protein
MKLRRNEYCPIHRSLSCCGREHIPKGRKTSDGKAGMVFARTPFGNGAQSKRGPAKCSVRNDLPCFSGHRTPPARKRAHNSHTGYGGDQVLLGFEKGVIDLATQCLRPTFRRGVNRGREDFTELIRMVRALT